MESGERMKMEMGLSIRREEVEKKGRKDGERESCERDF